MNETSLVVLSLPKSKPVFIPGFVLLWAITMKACQGGTIAAIMDEGATDSSNNSKLKIIA